MLCLYPVRTKALVLELLAAVCLVSGGHEIILYNVVFISHQNKGVGARVVSGRVSGEWGP